MPAITRDPDGTNGEAVFRVDWRSLEISALQPRRWLALLRPSFPPDPYLLARALDRLMAMCDKRSIEGRPLVWNQYALYLETSDHQGLRSVEAHIARDLLRYLHTALNRHGAVILGNLNVDLIRDEAGHVARGRALIRAEHRADASVPRGNLDDVTVRFDQIAARSPTDLDTVRPAGGLSATGPLSAAPLADAGGVRLRLNDGRQIDLPAGRRFLVGRVHADCPRNFIVISGATPDVSRKLFFVERSGRGALVIRHPEGTELSVNGRLLEPGGQVELDAFPATVTGSGDVVLARLER